eukprot:4712701-Ditylum_brightwellii.AAC.1
MVLDRRGGETAIRWGTVCNLVKSINAPTLLQLSDTELHIEKRKAWRKFYKLKKEYSPLRSALIEDKVKALNLEGEEKEAKKLSSILANEKERERAARLKAINHAPVCDQNGTPIVETVDLSEQKELEQACVEEVDSRSRMSEDTPPMVAPLVDLLGYSGITEKAGQILLGTLPPIAGIDEYTQLYIDQLRAVEGYLPETAKPASFSQCLNEV